MQIVNASTKAVAIGCGVLVAIWLVVASNPPIPPQVVVVSVKPHGEIAPPATATKTQPKKTPSKPIVLPSTQVAADLLSYTNAVRQQPLVYDLTLEQLAGQRALYLCSHDFSHDGYKDFIDKSGYAYVGENLARNFDSTQAMFDAFMASPTHKANILKPQYTAMGVGQACGVTVIFFGGFSNLI